MSDAIIYSEDNLRSLVPRLDARANKYSRGKLTVVAGCARYPGAACLAAYAAQRCGAGYVQVHCAPEALLLVQGFRPSLVASSWDGLAPRDLPANTIDKPAACVVGPGFDGQDEACRTLALKLLRGARSPVLVDGGALCAVATGEGRMLLHAKAEEGLAVVLTPHGGEAARLAGAARIEAPCESRLAELLAKAYRAVVVLKGPDTYISDGLRTAVVTCGTPALAKAGTGDVLAGMAGALLAQGLDPFGASVLAVELHARAGLACEARMPALCVTPEDVIEAIPTAIGALLPS